MPRRRRGSANEPRSFADSSSRRPVARKRCSGAPGSRASAERGAHPPRAGQAAARRGHAADRAADRGGRRHEEGTGARARDPAPNGEGVTAPLRGAGVACKGRRGAGDGRSTSRAFERMRVSSCDGSPRRRRACARARHKHVERRRRPKRPIGDYGKPNRGPTGLEAEARRLDSGRRGILARLGLGQREADPGPVRGRACGRGQTARGAQVGGGVRPGTALRAEPPRGA